MHEPINQPKPMNPWPHAIPEAEALKEARRLLETLPQADYYDCMDSEEFNCDDPVMAIEESALEVCVAVTVVAYRSANVTDQWITLTASWLIEHAAEQFDDEYGAPDGGQTFADEEVKRAEPAFETALRSLLGEHKAWHCDKVGQVALAVEHVAALMRDANPDWYEVDP